MVWVWDWYFSGTFSTRVPLYFQFSFSFKLALLCSQCIGKRLALDADPIDGLGNCSDLMKKKVHSFAQTATFDNDEFFQWQWHPAVFQKQ
jgi:hypothetical protein